MRARNRNQGVRKRCDCRRKDWPKCPHSWYFNFKAKNGPHYRLSLDREVGRHIDSKSTAIAEAERMNINAANALLKTLEEPAGATHLILTGPNSDAAPTIDALMARPGYLELVRVWPGQLLAFRIHRGA